MSIGRIALAAVLAGALAVSACGRKGDPIRPGSAEDPKTQTSN
jgi:predicted small lipoprotein YifL